MNKIFKIVKNRSTGLYTVASELAKGAKKGSAVAGVALLLSAMTNANATGVPQGYTPAANDNQVGKVTIASSGTLDLGQDKGFASAQKGEEVKIHTLKSNSSITELYNTKYQAVADAQKEVDSKQALFSQAEATYNQAKSHYEQVNANASATQQEKEDARNAMQNAKSAKDTAQTDLNSATSVLDNAKTASAAISDSKFKVDDPNGLLVNRTAGVVTEKEKYWTYRDPITNSPIQLDVIKELKEIDNSQEIQGGSLEFTFFEKMSDDKQYENMKVVDVNGAGTTVDVVNNGDPKNGNLTAITKGGGVIAVNDGANLNYNADTNYYTGNSGSSVSLPFEEKPTYTSASSTTLYGVTYKGKIQTIAGDFNVTDRNSFNAFNRTLKNKIRGDQQLRLDYPTRKKMQELYDAEIAKAYEVELKGTYTITYNVQRAEVDELAAKAGVTEQFKNRVTDADVNKDIGTKGVGDNYFIGVTGSGSTVNIAQGKTIKNSVDGGYSAGFVIKGDFENSGKNAENTYNINGTIEGNQATSATENSTATIKVKNANVNVANTGKVDGAIVVAESDAGKTNTLNNKGEITGHTYMANGSITNEGKMSNITGKKVKVDNKSGATAGNIDVGDGSEVTNDGAVSGSIAAGENAKVTNKAGSTVAGFVTVKNGSTIKNDSGATIKGVVVANGDTASFTNEGVVSGSINAVNGATGTNAADLVSEGQKDIIKLESGSKATNKGHIYIGYKQKDGATPTDPKEIVVSEKADDYKAINVNGKDGNNKPSTFSTDDNSKIYLAGNQTRATVVNVEKGGHYVATSAAEIVLNKEELTPVTTDPAEGSNQVKLDPEVGNNNTAVLVDEGSTADIAGTITLKDSGSRAVLAQDNGQVTFSGTVNLDSKDVGDAALVNIGLQSENEGSQITMKDSAVVNINSNRGIGVHVRDQGRVIVNDQAGVTFSNDKKDQIGFLISGITSTPNSKPAIEYNSTKDIQVKGENSVLMRIERGSQFTSNTLGGTHKPSSFDSNNSKNSTLMLVTSGATAKHDKESWQTQADLSNIELKVSGENAKGVAVQGGANAKITDSTKFSVEGDGATLAEIDGKYYDLNGKEAPNSLNGVHSTAKSILESAAILNASSFKATNSTGYLVKNNGVLSHSGNIDFTGNSNNNVGVKVVDGGKLVNNENSFIKVKGNAIEVSGNASEVEINSTQANTPIVWALGTGNTATPGAAYHLKDQSNLKLTGAGLTKAEGGAHGVLVDGASKVVIDSSNIEVAGAGNGIENRSALDNIQFINDATIKVEDGVGIHSGVGFSSPEKTNGVINVTGSGTGIKFEKINKDTGASEGDTDVAIQNTGFENVVINVRGAAGKGIDVHSTKDVVTSASVNVMDANGNSALIVDGTSENVKQSGRLQSASSKPIVSLNNNVKNFTNEGQLLSGTFNNDTFTAEKDETKFALKQGADRSALNFTNNGEINNTVELLGKNPDGTGNTVTLADGSKGELFKTGDGNDTFNVNKVTGADDDTQTRQFAKLDGGDGNDTVQFAQQSDFTINKADTITNIEKVSVADSSTLTLNKNLLTGTTEYNIKDADSKVVYNKNSAANVDAKLTGKGTFLFNGDKDNDTTRNDLNFTGNRNSGGAFEGTVEIKNANLTLGNANTDALTNAELKASDNSEVKVQSGDQAIRKLNFNGGLVDFGNVSLTDPASKSANHVKTTDLHLGAGKVRVDLESPETMANGKPLMEQDDAGMMSQLASSENAVTGNVDDLGLVDKNGNEIPASIKTDINQDGNNQVARVSYESKLTTQGDLGNGLYLRYGIDTVELKEKDKKGLKLDGTNKTGLAAELKAKVTDFVNGDNTKTEGDLQIVGSGEVTLNNEGNDYHGKTFVKESATLKAGSNNALGNTKELNLAGGTTFNLNGKTQTVGALNTAAGSTANVNGGNLTLAGVADSVVNGALTGAGKITVEDKTLTVNGSNTGLTANVTVGKDDTVEAKVEANKVDSLGTGDVEIKAKSQVNVALAAAESAVEIANKLTGTGKYHFNGDKTNAGQTEVGFKAGTNTGGTFEGEVELTNAKLNLAGDNTDALTHAKLKASENALVNVGQGAQNVNSVSFNGGTFNFGTVNASQASPSLASHHINTENLSLDSGKVQVDIGFPQDGSGNNLSLMEQDNDAMKSRLVQSANDITGDAGNVSLVDKDGNDLPNPTKLMVKQDGKDVARASYGTDLSVSTDKKGLDLSLGLNKVELKGQGDDALKLDATGKSDADAELKVQVTDFDNGDNTKTEGDLQIVGSGEVTLNNKDNDYHGKTLVKESAKLKAGSDNALGNTKELNLAGGTTFNLNGKTQTVGALNTAAGSTANVNGGNLTLAGVADSVVNGALTGAGKITVEDKTLTVNGSNTGLTANVTVGKDDTVEAKVEANKVDSLGTGDVEIKAKSQVNVALAAAESAVEIANKLTGTGKYHFNGDKTNAGQTEVGFKAGTNTGGTFEGEVELTNAKLNLAGDNTDALTHATLKLAKNSTATVGDAKKKATSSEVSQTIGALTLDGGLVDFGEVNLGSAEEPKPADNNIVADTLKIESNSKVKVNVVQDESGLVGGVPLLEQDDNGSMKARLIKATNIEGVTKDSEGKITNITMLDADGNPAKETMNVDLIQNAEKVARAVYDAKLTTDTSGLNIEHTLKEVQLKGTEENALKLDSSSAKTDKAKELTAKLTGFVNDDGSKTEGDLQIVGSGEVTLNNSENDYRGKTMVKDSATLKAGSDNALGKTKELNLAGGTTFDLNSKTQTVGTLNTKADSTANVNGGDLTIAGETDSVVDGALTGEGNIRVKDNTLTVNSSNTDLSADITIGNDDNKQAQVKVNKLDNLGKGAVKVNNDGVLDVTLATDGELTNRVITSDADDTSGAVNKNGAGTLTMNDKQAQYYGKTNLNEGSLIFNGTGDTVKSTLVNVKENATLIGLNNVTLEGKVDNNGTFHVGNLPGSTVVDSSTVTVGGYNGQDTSSLVFNGNLGGDDSPFNKLVVNGNTTGKSIIKVNDIAGTGEETKDGIKVVEVTGKSDAEFALNDRLSAGAFDYRLVKKESDWYLSSKGGLKPEVGSYLSNLVAANTMFDLRLHDRLGEPSFTGNKLEKGKWPSVWAKVRYDDVRFEDDRGHLTNKLHNRTIQLGSDIGRWSDKNENMYLVGVMGGYGRANSTTNNAVTGYSANGKLTGFNLGVYATMYANNKDQTGLHLDGWVLWNEFKGTVTGSKSTNHYDLTGVTASVEAGYTSKFEGKDVYNYFIQPKVQFTYTNVDAFDTQDGKVSVAGRGENLRTRVGVKAFMNNKTPNAEKVWQPFIEFNWLNNRKPYQVTVGSTKVEQGGVKNLGEVKVGFEHKASKNVDVWLSGAYQFGQQDFQKTSVQAGMKYSF